MSSVICRQPNIPLSASSSWRRGLQAAFTSPRSPVYERPKTSGKKRSESRSPHSLTLCGCDDQLRGRRHHAAPAFPDPWIAPPQRPVSAVETDRRVFPLSHRMRRDDAVQPACRHTPQVRTRNTLPRLSQGGGLSGAVFIRDNSEASRLPKDPIQAKSSSRGGTARPA